MVKVASQSFQTESLLVSQSRATPEEVALVYLGAFRRDGLWHINSKNVYFRKDFFSPLPDAFYFSTMDMIGFRCRSSLSLSLGDISE